MKPLKDYISEGILDDDFDVSETDLFWSPWKEYFKARLISERAAAKATQKIVEQIESFKHLTWREFQTVYKDACVARILSLDGGYHITLYYQGSKIVIIDDVLVTNRDKIDFDTGLWDLLGYYEFPTPLFERINNECKKYLKHYK